MTKEKTSKKGSSFAKKINTPGAKASYVKAPISKSPSNQNRSAVTEGSEAPSNVFKGSSTSGLSELQLKFKKKLEGARFRTINERLYTCRGDEAFTEFQTDPSLFDVVITIILHFIIF
jgi:ribosomal RNA-processing protein 8